MKVPPTPLQHRINLNMVLMASMYSQASPGVVEVPTKDFVEIFELIKDIDEDNRQLRKTITGLSKKNLIMSTKLKKIDMAKKRV